ncbi:MLO-like protein 9 [Canna indica]|uniref:MLO-like protein n=1 Tax=Canna indica TaxID=4628 RepID=A0AAQ3QHN4_9LILI|nr:MLO-like protein 9 [Canna indica]
MAGGGGLGNSRELDQTPTWAVAIVCAVIILISILLEKGIHHIGEWLTEKQKKALFEALEKVKAELMILGFISLLLTFGQSYIARICIPDKIANTMLPCPVKKNIVKEEEDGEHRRRLLTYPIMDQNVDRRMLAAGSFVSCPKGKVPLISTNGLHQLHIFIFFLAVFHVASSALTMALGRAKIRRWKEWESETSSIEYEFSNDPSRFRFAHETSFVRRHTSIWNRITVLFYFVSFLKQFFRSVHKADYLALRHGFINAHLAPRSKFNFQKYIKRALEDDFKLVVGISPVLWASAVVVLLLNVNGWEELFWASVLPLVIILAVGMKLQAIISKMAIEIQEKHSVVQGIPLVQLSDHHFWFGRPQFVLFLIHLSLFQNAFQIIYFLWIWYEFGLKSCFHDNFKFIIARISIGVGVQVLCSYITLPLYALVSQMGSHMKRSIFDEQTSKALKKWHQAVKKKHEKGISDASPNHEANPRTTPQASPVNPMQRSRTTGHISLTFSPSARRHVLDRHNSDNEVEMLSLTETNQIESEPMEHQLHIGEQGNNEDEFSFADLSSQAARAAGNQ